MEMRKEIIFMTLAVLLLAAFSCCLESSREETFGGMEVAPAAEPGALKIAQEATSYATDAAESDLGTVERKVIRTAYLSIEVGNFDEASSEVESAIEALGGFIADSSAYTTDRGKKRGTITARVPEEMFSEAIARLEKVGRVESKRISGQDVTEEYIDLEARLNNSRRTEGRLLDILEKAEKVEDILRVEKELARVREEIERLTGRMRYLDDRIDLSTVTVELYEPEPITQSWGLRDAIRRSIMGFIGSTNSMIVFVGSTLPVAIVLMVLYSLFRRRKGKN